MPKAKVHSNVGGAPPGSARDADYSIYMIERLNDGRRYVGLTRRSVEARIRSHVHDAARRRRVRRGGLAADIRRARRAGIPFDAAFRWRVLEKGLGLVAAKRAEARWVERLHSNFPRGFNMMPAGGVGGPALSQCLVVHHPALGVKAFAAIGEAIGWVNRDRAVRGLNRLAPATVFYRLSAGWSPEEALGLAPRTDGRSLRAPFRFSGRTYRSLREVSAASGVGIETLRSRLQRARALNGGDLDIGDDRRRGSVGRRPSLPLPHPEDAGRTVDAATLIYRFAAVARQSCGAQLPSRGELLRALTHRCERRKVISLTVGGVTLEGGIREVISRVLRDPALEAQRRQRLGLSGIRRRLRLVKMTDQKQMAWAFGFRDRRPIGRNSKRR